MPSRPSYLPSGPVRIADAHVHFYSDAQAEAVVEAAERYGVQRIFVSCVWELVGPRAGSTGGVTPEGFRLANRLVSRWATRYPDLIIGYAYVNPCYEDEAMRELRTGVEELGMRGLKLLTDCYHDDPRVFPLVERAITYDIPMLLHTWSKAGGNSSNESDSRHVGRLAERYPEAKIIMAHLSGNWPVMLKPIHRHPNVHVDTSGTDPEDGQVETAVALLGPRRVVFGSDYPGRDLGSQIAKIFGAAVDPETRDLILWGNLDRLLGGSTR